MDKAKVSQQYHIATKAPPVEDRPRVLKYGSIFAVFDRHGDIRHHGMGEQGIYFDGTRHLSEMVVRLWNERPLLLSSTVEPNNFLFTADLANLDVSKGDSVAIQRGTLHVLRSKFLWRGASYEEFQFVNYGLAPLSVPVTLSFAADFAAFRDELAGAIGVVERMARREIQAAALIDDWRLQRLRKLDEATLQVFWRDWPNISSWAGALWRKLNDDLDQPARPTRDPDLDEVGGSG